MDILKTLQENSFLVTILLGLLGGAFATYMKFKSMGEKIHSLHKRLSIIEDTRISHIEATVATQASLLSAINATVSSMDKQLAAISTHLLGKSK